MKRARIVLVDDHILLLDVLKHLLQPEFEVVGAFSDGHALLAAAPELNPEVVIIDIGMPTMNGLNAGERLKQILPKVKLIYLTMNQDPSLAAEAFRLGASGYLLKNSAASELVYAIREALLGRSFVTPLVTKDLVDSFVQNLKHHKSHRRLTLRQKEVLQLLAEGLSMKEVAHILGVSPRTVAFHKYTMMEQLQVKTNAELIQFAMKSSMVSA
ncbi:MAG TPA: response regulator transcription factor [Blastocatellia bacterium]|nr:response regulator transcription factor [Blastocatellia bacterium]